MMIRIIIEFDKDTEEQIAIIFGRVVFSVLRIDGTGWTEFKEYIKEIFVRKNIDYSKITVIK